MMDSMTQNAKNSGLDFHFEKSNYGQFIQCTPTLAFGKKIQQVKRTRRIIV
jgi:hypothetical protein